MTLGEILLSKLADSRTAGRTNLFVDDPRAEWTVALELEARDQFGCRVGSLTVRRRTGRCETKSWAEAAAQRVHGLLERLIVLEYDSSQDEAMLRSEAPTVRFGERGHFELRIKNGTTAQLTRFTAPVDPLAKRRPTTFDLTNDVLAKLVDDLTAGAN